MKQEETSEMSTPEKAQENAPKKGGNGLGVPIAIVVAGLIIAGAVLYSGNSTPKVSTEIPQEVLDIIEIKKDDHVLGNKKAEIVILEYSDTECPFCKQFHTTLHQVVDDYEGEVAWVYRHFPIASLHSKAQLEAEATECAAELGGEDKFWSFIDRIYTETPSNNGLDLTLLPKFAEEIGIDKAAFEECLQSERHAEKIKNQIEEVVSLGGEGTPHSFLLYNGQIMPIPGAQPLESIKGVIDSILAGEFDEE